MVRIYTRSGDDGFTSLIGGARTSKNSPRLEAYGTVDELNAILGQAISQGVAIDLYSKIKRIQNDLFTLGAELACEEAPSPSRVNAKYSERLETWIDELSQSLPPLTQFILPGGAPAASTLHVARTVCRRAERRLVALHETQPCNNNILRYINRLSDLLFVMARTQNQAVAKSDEIWKPEE